MYYKKGYLDVELKKQYLTDYTAEFALALCEKISNVQNASIGIIRFTKDNEDYKRAIVVIQGKREDSFSYMDIDSTIIDYKYSRTINLSSFDRENVSNLDIKIIEANKETIKKEFNVFDENMYKKAKNLVSDFCNVVNTGVLYDKKGEEYQYKIIENSDSTLGDIVLLDELRLYKNGKQIGYLKTKYTTEEIAEKLLKKEFSILNKKFTKKDKVEYLERNNIDFTDENLNVVFQLQLKMLKEDYKSFKKNDIFNNLATIDFSRITDESCLGTGLGQQMYLKIAEHYNKKGIEFRSSMLQSDSAKNMWEKLIEKHPNLVEEIYIGDNKCYKLKVGEGMDVFNKPQKQNKKKQKVPL